MMLLIGGFERLYVITYLILLSSIFYLGFSNSSLLVFSIHTTDDLRFCSGYFLVLRVLMMFSASVRISSFFGQILPACTSRP